MMRAGEVRTDIVLVGGGHAHVHVLKAFAAKPEPGVRLTLVTRDLETPYSGMLPGVIAGLYSAAEAHIDLLRLTAVTGARLIHAEATGLDRKRKRLALVDRPPIAYDLLSINVGVTPALAHIDGASKYGIAAKPIGSLLGKIAILRARCRAPDGPRRIVVIGGGAGGVELILSLRSLLIADALAEGRNEAEFSFALVTEGEMLSTHNSKVRAHFRRALAAHCVQLHENSRACAVTASSVVLDDGRNLSSDAVLVATGAAAPPWFRESGLRLDKHGFLAVGPTLQVLNDADILGAGDCVNLIETPREKAGVYAVRAGPPLARNLRLRVRGQALKRWRPQWRHLALISTGQRHAVASRGSFKAEGAWVWHWKDRIDRRWMRMHQDIVAMLKRMPKVKPDEPQEELRCGGCAAKIGPLPLATALSRLPPSIVDRVVIGLDAPDDAAVLLPPKSGYLVQTVDFFRAFVDDSFVFGEIAANHALNDVFAMGGTPRHALATAVVPIGPSDKVGEALFQLLSGARACLDREGVALVGGHSSEGVELSLGLSVTGEVATDGVVRKGGLAAGDALILTRPIGTGILFAAAMRGHARAGAIVPALAEMRRSNREAATILLRCGARAMTDVSGFGLAGHLGEMLMASGAEAVLDFLSVPIYADVALHARSGIASTLLPGNLVGLSRIKGELHDVARSVLFDPQTSGGLLAGIPAGRAEGCVAELRLAGHFNAAIIGEIMRVRADASPTLVVRGGTEKKF